MPPNPGDISFSDNIKDSKFPAFSLKITLVMKNGDLYLKPDL